MRRLSSISLILLLWLGPLVTVLPGFSDARLPFCCRRQGAHHCAMDAGASQASGSGVSFTAPSRCSQFPVTPAISPSHAFTGPVRHSTGPAVSLASYILPAGDSAARDGSLRTQFDRGPPAQSIV